MKSKIYWLSGCLAFLCFLGSTTAGHAQWGQWGPIPRGYGGESDLPRGLHPYITVEEEYNSNIYFTNTNTKDDWITKIYPGVMGSLGDPDRPEWGFNVNANLGLAYFAKNPDANYLTLLGRLNTWYTFDRGLTFRLREYALRSDAPREESYSADALPGEYQLAVQHGNFTYFRNAASPSLDYQFGEENHLTLNYRNTIYQTQNPDSENSQENYLNPRITYWFDIHNGVLLEYGLLKGEFEKSPDLTGHMAHGRYTYRVDPRTSIYGDYIYLRREFQSGENDYEVSNPAIGVTHAFTPTLEGTAKVGYYSQNRAGQPANTGMSFLAGLTQRTSRARFSLRIQGGYTEDYFTAQNLGFTQYYQALGLFVYQITQESTLRLIGLVERAEYASDRTDWIYTVNLGYSYLLLRWLTLTGQVSRGEDHSSQSLNDYVDYRALLRLTASH